MPADQKLDTELKTAILSHDKERASILKMLKTALQYAALNKSDKKLTDEESLNVLQKERKKRLDAAQLYEDNAEPRKAAGERAEADVIAEFLPEPLSESETLDLIKSAISETGANEPKDIGSVMNLVKQRSDGRLDSGLAAKLIRENLGK